MGPWLKFLWSRAAGAWRAAIANRPPWWIPALVAIVLVVIFCAVWIGGGELGAAVAAAVAATLSAVATFLLWQVMKAQTVILREQTDALRPGCRVYLFLHDLPGAQPSLIGYHGEQNEFIGMTCTVVPKAGCDVVPIFASIELLDRNEKLLYRMFGDALGTGTGEIVWRPEPESLTSDGMPVYVVVATTPFRNEVERLIPQGLAKVRVSVTSNHGTDVSESILLPPLNAIGRLESPKGVKFLPP